MKREQSIGKKLAPILKEIEETLWEYEANDGGKPDYPVESLGSACKIFMSVLLDKAFECQLKHGLNQEQAEKETELIGYKIRALVLEHTGIDTHDLYDFDEKSLEN